MTQASARQTVTSPSPRSLTTAPPHVVIARTRHLLCRNPQPVHWWNSARARSRRTRTPRVGPSRPSASARDANAIVAHARRRVPVPRARGDALNVLDAVNALDRARDDHHARCWRARRGWIVAALDSTVDCRERDGARGGEQGERSARRVRYRRVGGGGIFGAGDWV